MTAVQPLRVDVLTLRWPDQRHLDPRRCPREHCGSNLIEVDAPYGTIRHGEVRCLTCSRTLCYLREDGTRPLPAFDQPRRGRPPRAMPDPQEALRQAQQRYRDRLHAGQLPRERWARDFDACVQCGLTARPHHAYGRCYACRDRVRERDAARARRAARAS